jgi:hypothetical protein
MRIFRVRDLNHILTIIIPFFLKYPLPGRKNQDFLDFCKVARMMEKGEHLTPKGLEQIKLIKEGMNKGRPFPSKKPE